MDPEAFIPLIVVGLILLVPLIWLIGTYNGLVRARNTTTESWSNVDTELKRRYDLIPNLVQTVKGYAAHERQALETVIEARNRAVASNGTPAEQARDENLFIRSLRQLFMLVEGYPDLKANRNFLALQEELTNTEDRIQAARRFYNANVRDLNNRVQMFPSSIVASLGGFKPGDYFEIEDAGMRAAPQVALGGAPGTH
jgi:LemA protein